MQEVVAAVRRVTDLMGEISAASTEQSQGVTEVIEDRAADDELPLISGIWRSTIARWGRPWCK